MSCLTLCNLMDCSTQYPLSSTVSQRLLKFMFSELVMLSNHFILCHPLLLSSIFLNIRVFCNDLALHIGGQSIGASASVLPMNIQGWCPLGLTGLISLQSKQLSRVPQFESISSSALTFFGLPHWLSGKESTCQCRRCKRHEFNHYAGKIPWRRKWQPILEFLPGKSHG